MVKEDNGIWQTPGGGLDFGEEIKSGLAREIKEEMGLEVLEVEDRPSYVYTSQNKHGIWSVHIVYVVKLKNLDFKESRECVEIGFFSKEEAVKVIHYPNAAEFINLFNPDNH